MTLRPDVAAYVEDLDKIQDYYNNVEFRTYIKYLDDTLNLFEEALKWYVPPALQQEIISSVFYLMNKRDQEAKQYVAWLLRDR